MEAGLMKRMLLKGKREWGIGEKNVAEVEAGLMKRMLLKWKRDWWKECSWNGSRSDEKNIAENAWNGSELSPLQISINIDIIFCDELSATNCPWWIVLQWIVHNELSCDELYGNGIVQL